MELRAGRRLSTMDAMILVGLTALGMGRLPSVWPESWAVFRRIDLGHIGENFEAWPSGGRMDSMGLMARNLLRPILGWNQPRPGFQKPDGTRSTRQEELEEWAESRTNHRSGGKAAGYVAAVEVYVLAFPFLVFWTIGLMIIRLRRPRPEPGLLWRQPGWCGCVAAVVGIGAGLAEEALIGWDAYTILVPAAVLLAWLGLWLSRRWSAEASWIDRAGRCLAVGWLALIPPFIVGFALPFFR